MHLHEDPDDIDEFYRQINANFSCTHGNIGEARRRERELAPYELRLFQELDAIHCSASEDADQVAMNALLDELDIEAADAEPEGASEQSKLAPLLNLVATARAAYPKYQRRKHTVIIPVDASPAERRRLKRNSRERQDRAAENGGKSRAYRADRRTMTPEQQRQHDSALGAVRKRRWKEKHGAASPASSGD